MSLPSLFVSWIMWEGQIVLPRLTDGSFIIFTIVGRKPFQSGPICLYDSFRKLPKPYVTF